MLKKAFAEGTDLAVNGLGTYLTRRNHLEGVRCDEKRHHESIDQGKFIHRRAQKISKQTYLMTAFNSLEKHFQVFQQLNFIRFTAAFIILPHIITIFHTLSTLYSIDFK